MLNLSFVKFFPFIIGLFILFISPCGCRPLDNNEDGLHPASNGVSVPLIIVAAVAVTICFIFVVALCTCCQDALFSAKPDSSPPSMRHSNSMEPPGHSSPGTPRLGEDDRVTIEPLPDISVKRTSVVKYGKPMDYNHAVNKGLMVEDWFHGSKISDFPRNQLEYVKELGNGWFGHVVEGEAAKIIPNVKKSKVLVKILREDLTSVERAFALYEARKHRDLKHDNILNLLGKSFEKQPYLLIYEYVSKGDLKHYLSKNRSQSEELIQNGTLMRMCSNIASGLSYCHENDYVLNDVACRNFYVTTDGTVKLGDCGVSVDLYKDDYLVVGDIAVPIRWTAPESIEANDAGQIVTKEITKAANVWSFGVVFWEVLEFAKRPYMELTNEQVIQEVIRRRSTILPEPLSPVPSRDKCYQTMKMCWKWPAENRPSMQQVAEMLNYLCNNHQQTVFDDFESKWNNLVPVEKLLLDADSISPVPADPVTSKVHEAPKVVEIDSPSKVLSRQVENVQTQQPQSMLLEKHPEVATQAQQPRAVILEKQPELTRDLELERIDKRNFILTLNNEELANLKSSEMVQFYEYLSKDEISDLEKRHSAAIEESSDKKEKLKLKEQFLAMSLDDMDLLTSDQLQTYLDCLDEPEKQETTKKLAKNKEKRRLFSLGTKSLASLGEEDLRKAKEILNEQDFQDFSKRVGDAKNEDLGRQNALKMLNSTDFELATNENRENLKKFLTPDEVASLEKRLNNILEKNRNFLGSSDDELADMNEETFENGCNLLTNRDDIEMIRKRRLYLVDVGRKRKEILNLEGLGLYRLFKSGWEDHLACLNDDEVNEVMSRLEQVRNIREELLKTEPDHVLDESKAQAYLEPSELHSLLDQRAKEKARRGNLIKKLLHDPPGLDLLKEYENNAEEIKILLNDDQSEELRRRLENVRQVRSSFLNEPSGDDMDAKSLSDYQFYFTDQEYSMIETRQRDAAVKREQIRSQVLNADNLALYLLSVEGLEHYLNYLDEQEALALSHRLDEVVSMRKTLADEIGNETNDDILTEYFTDAEIADLKRKRDRERDDSLRDEILMTSGLRLYNLYHSDIGKYRNALTAEELKEVEDEVRRIQENRETVLNASDLQLAEIPNEKLAPLADLFTPEEFDALKLRHGKAVETRRDVRKTLLNPDVLVPFEWCLVNDPLQAADYLTPEEYETFKTTLQDVNVRRSYILAKTPMELCQLKNAELNEYKPVLSRDEFDQLSTLRNEAREARDGILSLNETQLKSLTQEQLERYYKFLTSEEIDKIEKARLVEHELPLVGGDFDDSKFHLFKNVAEMTTSTPEGDSHSPSKTKMRRLERLSLSTDIEQIEPTATAKDLDEHETARKRILELDDTVLSRMSLGEVENFFQYLSPVETLQLKERKQKLDEELSTTFFDQSVPPTSGDDTVPSSSGDKGSTPSTAGATGFMDDEMWGEVKPSVPLRKERELLEDDSSLPFTVNEDLFKSDAAVPPTDQSVNPFFSDDEFSKLDENRDLPSFRDYLKTAPTLSTLSGSFDQSSVDYSSDEKNNQTTPVAPPIVEEPPKMDDILIDFGFSEQTPTPQAEINKPLSLFTEIDDIFGQKDSISSLKAPEINLIPSTPTAERSPSSPDTFVLTRLPDDGLVEEDAGYPEATSTPVLDRSFESATAIEQNSSYATAASEISDLATLKN